MAIYKSLEIILENFIKPLLIGCVQWTHLNVS